MEQFQRFQCHHGSSLLSTSRGPGSEGIPDAQTRMDGVFVRVLKRLAQQESLYCEKFPKQRRPRRKSLISILSVFTTSPTQEWESDTHSVASDVGSLRSGQSAIATTVPHNGRTLRKSVKLLLRNLQKKPVRSLWMALTAQKRLELPSACTPATEAVTPSIDVMIHETQAWKQAGRDSESGVDAGSDLIEGPKKALVRAVDRPSASMVSPVEIIRSGPSLAGEWPFHSKRRISISTSSRAVSPTCSTSSGSSAHTLIRSECSVTVVDDPPVAGPPSSEAPVEERELKSALNDLQMDLPATLGRFSGVDETGLAMPAAFRGHHRHHSGWNPASPVVSTVVASLWRPRSSTACQSDTQPCSDHRPSSPSLSSLSPSPTPTQSRIASLSSTIRLQGTGTRTTPTRQDPAVARSLLYKAVLMLEYGLSLRSVLGTPPPLQSASEAMDAAGFMRHADADLAILDYFLLRPSRDEAANQEGHPNHGSNTDYGHKISSMGRRRLSWSAPSLDRASPLMDSTKRWSSNAKSSQDTHLPVAMLSLAAQEVYKHPLSQFCYAMCLIQGVGCRSDPVNGMHWLRMAAEAGETMAMFELAVRLRSPEHGKWLRLAANDDTYPVGEACLMLALDYYHAMDSMESRNSRLGSPGIASVHGKEQRHRKQAASYYFRRGAACGVPVPAVPARWVWKPKYDHVTLEQLSASLPRRE